MYRHCVANYSIYLLTHALLLVLLFISCATITLLCIRAMLLLFVQLNVPLQCLPNPPERPPKMCGQFWSQELDVSALCCFRSPTAPLHSSPLTPDAFFVTFCLAPLSCATWWCPLNYFLFLDIQHCPSGLHILLLLCESGIYVNYNKWKFLRLLQDILCFFSHTNL